MQAEVVSIGNEVLAGAVINTNSAFISKVLKDQGYDVQRHSVYPDELLALESGFKESLARAKIVVVTGGLGPTFDDITKKALCQTFTLSLQYHADIAKDLERRFKNIDSVSIKELSLLPEGVSVFKNSLGTAPGMAFPYDGSVIVFLPGVPSEMQDMLITEVVPFLHRHFPVQKKFFQKKVFFTCLSELDIDPVLRKMKKKYPDIRLGIYPGVATIEVQLTSHEEDEEKANTTLLSLQEELISCFADNVYSTENAKISFAIHEILTKKKKTLAFAESCSGGALAKEITSIPNSSKYFLGSIVSYADDVKKNILQVKDNTLKKHGAVSVETVDEMVGGVLQVTGADYAVAISGIAGPSGGTFEKPVGTVCIAIKEKGEKSDIQTIHVKGNRQNVVEYVKNYSLCLLWQKIFHNRLFIYHD